jgi:hypothetical protein
MGLFASETRFVIAETSALGVHQIFEEMNRPTRDPVVA